MPRGLRNPSGPHLSESLFRRYEKSLSDFLRTYPSPFYLSLSNVTPSSLRVSFRNAANSFIQHRWSSTLLDHSEFSSVWPNITIQPLEDKILVCLPAHRHNAQVEEQNQANAPVGLTITNPTEEVLLALCTLHSASVLTLPTKLLACPSFEVQSPLVLDFQPDGSAILF